MGPWWEYREKFELRWQPEPNSGCWLMDDRSLYGQYRCKSGNRASWLVYCGEIPFGALVCHKCDVKGCVNPGHLYLGTASDNVQDSWDRARSDRRERMKAEWRRTWLSNRRVKSI